ncbi:MAG: thermosome subunit [Candidatus Methanomethylicota archaeon]|uniref:Thermosome subunit n=1 Tax=Thermoproteota archaeon TaxID=2056631 RepID=A0A497EZI7_9CREN|nr:MAG: thermosome subunit [Candidatus Verstraetearchaeota archaeon]RLE52813.1 MAG: thermosome subunit [Candidatus Verstraetearchaeota archaeon]
MVALTTAGSTPVLILKEGTTRTVGRDALRANITAATIIAETVRSSLGPRGMDKMLVDSFGDVTITNDGATILKEMEVQHPAAKMLVEVSKAQDSEVGDGTTTAVVLAGSLLRKAEELLDQNVHPTMIIEGYKKAMDYALKVVDEVAIRVDPMDRTVLKNAALTTLSGKAVIAGHHDLLAELAIEACLQVAEKVGDKWKVDLDNIKVEKKKGESLDQTQLVKGIVLDKEVVHPGMPKRVEKAKIAVLDCPLEIEKTEISAKIHITTPEQMKSFLDEEATMLRNMVDKLASVGANVVIVQKGIDDIAQHYLAKKGILAVRRAKRSDIEALARASGARIVTALDDLTPEDLGYAELVEERKVGKDKMVFIEGCKNPRAVTILVRGGSDRMVDEAERSIHDALCVVRNIIQDARMVPGGGAVEAEVAHRLREWARTLSGREQLAALKFAEAIEEIPAALAENSGLDPVDILVELRSRHARGEKTMGIDVVSGKVSDMIEKKVIEPAVVKLQAIKSATEAAITILKIDDVIASAPPKKEKEEKEKGVSGAGESFE